MKEQLVPTVFLVSWFAVTLACPLPAGAFYSYTGSQYDITLAGSFAAGVGGAKYPEAGVLYTESSDTSWYGDLRLLADASAGEHLGARFNVLQNVRTTPVFVPTGATGFQPDVERSGLFYRQQHDSGNTQAALVLDSGCLKYIDWKNELAIGRQPVSTTVTFFFTPNDFFAPFSPNTFYRVYKPGVDALRYERRIAALSQLSIIGVLGYKQESDADGGWSDAPDWHRSSMLARFTRTDGGFEWGMLGGIVRESVVTGFSLQGEFFQWLGVRAEGHYANTWAEDLNSGLMITISFEHRFPSSLNLRLEQMYNGYGTDSLAETLAERKEGVAGQGYLGRHYSAFDINYQISPLLVGELLFLRNWSDDSYSLSVNAVLSTSDESELAFTAAFPGGAEPAADEIRSELGSLPLQFSLEYRHYF